MKRRVVALVLILQVFALSVFTGCGKEKLEQDKGVMSSEMTDDEINVLKEFGVSPKDISKHFTNFVVSTPKGSYDLLSENMDVLSNKDTFVADVVEQSIVENENLSITMLYQPFNLDKYTFVNTGDVYFNGNKEKRVFGYCNVQYKIYGEAGDSDVSIMGITNRSDLDSILDLFGEPQDVGEAEMWKYYRYLVSMKGIPVDICVTWNLQENEVESLEIGSYSRYNISYEEDFDFDVLEDSYKNK